MAAAGEFWLPSEFLSDDGLLSDKDYFKENHHSTAFPADFGSYGSPVESVVGSTETESDEEDLIAGLTRRTQKLAVAPQNLEKQWVLSGSPQSTLSGVGSRSGRSAMSSNGSPRGPLPTGTPLGCGDDTWDLIYAAAGQVARLKMNGEGPPRNRGLVGPPWCHPPIYHPTPPVKTTITGFYSGRCPSQNFSHRNHIEHARRDQTLNQLNPPCSSVWGRPYGEGLFAHQNQFQQQLLDWNGEGRVLDGGGFESTRRFGRPVGLPQSVWPAAVKVQRQNYPNQPLQHGGSGMKAVSLGASAVKKRCAGTGVFLPRRFNDPSETRVKPGCSTALLPARVVQALNKNFDETAGRLQPPPSPQFSGPLVHDVLDGRMNLAVAVAVQRRSLQQEGVVNHDLCLPKEWTY